jgi:hypothetical protein
VQLRLGKVKGIAISHESSLRMAAGLHWTRFHVDSRCADIAV